jgi:hypothetical protein
MRKLNDVRKYIDNTIMIKNRPEMEARITRQIVDLSLLKYAVVMKGYADTTIIQAIDSCIEGFIWIYANGGTSNTMPSIIYSDPAARQYYDNFMMNWGKLQEFMRLNMSLMEL